MILLTNKLIYGLKGLIFRICIIKKSNKLSYHMSDKQTTEIEKSAANKDAAKDATKSAAKDTTKDAAKDATKDATKDNTKEASKDAAKGTNASTSKS